MGVRMQFHSSEDAYRREITPKSPSEMGQTNPEAHSSQEDQWAILRHEVEGEDMRRQDERVRLGWEPRDTEEDAISHQPFYDSLEQTTHHVDIVVAGVGGGGMNAVDRMINTRVRGVRFVAMNTDAQVLSLSEAPERICLGQHYTKGLGTGGHASVGARAATESAAEIAAALGNADLVFIAAGMGGGTGTGGAPVVASIAKKMGALTVGIVTLPFTFEGTRRRRIAEEGLAALATEIDALITIPNDRLLSITGRDQSLSDAFKIADDVLRQGVQGIAEVINVPGLVNVDFADVRSVLREAGTALMSIGQGHGRNRAQLAAEEAIAGGFLNVTIRGAQRVLFNISGGEDMTLFEVNEVAEYIGNAIDTTADITFGAVIDPALDDTIRVTLIAASMDERRTLRSPASHMNAINRVHTHSSPLGSLPNQGPSASHDPVSYSPSQSIDYQQPPSPGPPSVSPGQAVQSLGPSMPPHRLQRSLDDLRGLRSLGRRQEMPKENPHSTDGKDELEAVDEVDVPRFLKKFT